MKRNVLLILSAVFALAPLGSLLSAADAPENRQIPINQRATAAAWKALGGGDYAKAIERASECIERFGKPADQVQSILEQQQASLPAGNVSAEEKTRIDRYQILHDVAACLLIRARAEAQLGQTEKAKADYEHVQRYTYARILESPGQHYSVPAELAPAESKKLPR